MRYTSDVKQLSKGFTIVELLIVIIVIGILATITIVAYNGVQDRAEYAHAQSDLKHINDAITIYKSQNAQYPPMTGGPSMYYNWTWQYLNGAYQSDFLNVLVPSYLDKMPLGSKQQGDTRGCSYAYTTNSTFSDYKLLRICDSAKGGLPTIERSNNPLIDPVRTTTAWGYWSDGAASW